jgi:hypothetical protein
MIYQSILIEFKNVTILVTVFQHVDKQCSRFAEHYSQSSEVILDFRTLSIVQVLRDKTKEEHDVSENGSVFVLR